jgi:uncharacterized membrane protein
MLRQGGLVRTSQYLERLKADLGRWVDNGLLGAELAGELLSDAASHEAHQQGGPGAVTLLGLTAVAIGILTVIASNWPGVGDLGRLGILFGAAAAACLGSAELRVRGFIAAANLLAALAAVIAGGGLVIIGQLYHDGATTAAFLGAWRMAAAAVSLLLWSPLAAAVTAMTTVAWTIFALAESEWMLGEHVGSPPAALLVILALGAMAHLKRSLFVAHLVIAASFVWATPYIGDLVVALIADWEDRPVPAALTAVAIWAALAAAFEVLARLKGAFAARTAAGWAAWVATLGLVTVNAGDQVAGLGHGLLVPLLSLGVFTALTVYGAAPGRRWLRGAGATGFVLTALTLFGWTGKLALAGLSLILVGVSLILLLWGTSRLAKHFRTKEGKA